MSSWPPSADVDAVVCLLTDRIDEVVLAAGAAGRLQVVANVAVGYDNIDVAAAGRLGIDVCNTPGVLDETTADLAFLLILAASRLGWEAERDLRAGCGRDGESTSTWDVMSTGPCSASWATAASAPPWPGGPRGFGMRVLHHTRTATGVPGYIDVSRRPAGRVRHREPPRPTERRHPASHRPP